jgi:hypothetical protein
MGTRGRIATWRAQSMEAAKATAGVAGSKIGHANRHDQNALGLVGLQAWSSHC